MSPVVPFISQPRVGLNPLPGVRVSTNAPITAFGGGVAAQKPDLSGPAQVAGGVAEQNALDRQRIRTEAALEADQIAVTHAVSATTLSVNDMLHGQNGLFNRKGNQAFTIDQDAYDQYGATVADIRSQLTNDRQRAVYDKHVLNQWDAIDSQVQPYIAAQRQKFDKEGVDAGLLGAKNAAIQSPLNPVVVEQSVSQSKAIAESYAHRLGMPDEAVKAAGADAASDVHLSVIQSMLSQPNVPDRDRMAAAYFDTHKSELIGKDRLDADRLTKASSIEGDVLRTTDKIVGTTQTEGDAYAEAAKITDPAIREKVENRIALVYNRKAGMQREAQNVAFEDGYKTLLANHYDPSSIPVSTREKMGAMHYQNLVAEAHQQLAYYASGGVGDPEKLNQLISESIHDPEKFASEQINGIKGLNEAQKTHLLNLQRPAEKADLVPLTRELTAAEASLRRAQNAAQTARVNGDAETEAKWKKEAESVQMRVDAAKAAIARKGAPGPAGEHFARSYSTPATPLTVPASPTSSQNPAALTPALKPPNAAMAVDIARARGDGALGKPYLDALRKMGIDVDAAPIVAPQAPEAPKAKPPAVHETVVKRGPDGKIQSTTTTVTKPE